MVTTYFWNMALSRELMLSLGMVEIIMRNGIHRALTSHTGHPDWYDHIVLLPRQQSKIDTTRTEIANAGKPVTPGRIVAGLDFGFWTGLLSSGYGAIWTPNNAALIGVAFPHLTAVHRHRGFAHSRFNNIRRLRNRISHHEPIWQGVRLNRGQPLVTLARMYADIVEAIGWVSPTLRDSVNAFDRFPDTLQNGQVTIAAQIKQHLNIP